MGVDWQLQITDPASPDYDPTVEEDKLAADATYQSTVADENRMSAIVSYVQPGYLNALFACGYQHTSYPVETTPAHPRPGTRAAMFKMNLQGDVEYMWTWGTGRNFQPDLLAPEGIVDTDTCRTISYSTETREVTMVLETTSDVLRPGIRKLDSIKHLTDILIIRMGYGGDLIGAHNINQDTAAIAMGIGIGSFSLGENMFFVGHQSGYRTRIDQYTSATPDAYLFRHNPDRSDDCLYKTEIDVGALNSISTKYTDKTAISARTSSLVFRSMPSTLKGVAYLPREIKLVPLVPNIRPSMC
jgi:hypothetical protein